MNWLISFSAVANLAETSASMFSLSGRAPRRVPFALGHEHARCTMPGAGSVEPRTEGGLQIGVHGTGGQGGHVGFDLPELAAQRGRALLDGCLILH
ncbi:MAG: hypothetical protein U0636_05690 [Phycisphaerales bacterium]